MKISNLRSIRSAGILAVVLLLSASVAHAQNRNVSPRIAAGPTIYVISQGLYYDSIVTASELPHVGPFQQLFPTGTLGLLETEVGPGDEGFVGGRWWVDSDSTPGMSVDDDYFSCPLLAPGRDTIDP